MKLKELRKMRTGFATPFDHDPFLKRLSTACLHRLTSALRDDFLCSFDRECYISLETCPGQYLTTIQSTTYIPCLMKSKLVKKYQSCVAFDRFPMRELSAALDLYLHREA